MPSLTAASIILLYLTTVCRCQAGVLTVLIAPTRELIPWNENDGNLQEAHLKKYTVLDINIGSDDNNTDLGQTESAKIIRESDLLVFYNNVYSQSNSLVIFLDLRHEACPIDLFRQRLLGYVTLSDSHCSTLSDFTSSATVTVDTWSFDLMMFMTEFLASLAKPANVDNYRVSFALLFDKTGEDHFLLPNRKVTKKLTFEITLPMTNCTDSDHVTQLAAKTNIKDVIIIALTSCIYDLMLAVSRLHLPPTRFRWLLYPMDYNGTFKRDGLSRFFDNVSPIILTERERPLNRPVYSHVKLLRFVNHVTTSFLLAVQNKQTITGCQLNCTSECTLCQALFMELIKESSGQDYEVYGPHSQTEKQTIVFDLNRLTSRDSVYVGNWSQETGLNVNQVVYPSSFIDSQLSVVVVVEPPFVFRNVSENGVANYYGYSIDVLKEISQRLRFSYTVSECDAGGYGLLEKGKWTGCIGNVVRGEADVILGALTVTAERDQVIDFTLPYYNFAGIQILMKKQAANINLFYYANVFSTQAWMSLAAVVVVTSILLWGFEKVTSTESRKGHYSINTPITCANSIPLQNNDPTIGVCTITVNRKDNVRDGNVYSSNGGKQNEVCSNNLTHTDSVKVRKGSEKRSSKENNNEPAVSKTGCTLAESAWYVIGSLAMAGGGDPPRSFSGRLLIAGFWFFSVILMSTFTANLAAFLTVSRMGMTITSLDDLARQTYVKYAVVNQSSVMEYFQRMAQIEKDFYERWKAISLDKSTDDTQDSLAVWDYPLGNKYDAMWTNIKEAGLIKSNEVGLERVMSETFALITESPLIQYYTGMNCNLMGIGEQFSIRPYAIGLKERSLYASKFSEAILDLQKERELGSLRLKWWASNGVSCPKENSNTGLDLYSLSGTFIVAGAGVVSGFVLLGLEHVASLVAKRRRAKFGDNNGAVLPGK